MTDALLAAGYLAAFSLSSLRWLRVAQREHYHRGRVVTFALRWWLGSGPNRALIAWAGGAAVLAAVLGGTPAVVLGLTSMAAVAAGPVGLSLRGRTAPLAWTRRLRLNAALTLLLAGGVLLLVARVELARLAALAALLTPLLVELALAIDVPVERLLTKRYVDSARATLRRVRPRVVGITGSYGKTTVKFYAAHLLGRTTTALASRASYNNRLGLALSVNEDLGPGTDVFVAEMGTYGTGEIRELCGWLRPSIGVITAIGPVHLERMGSIENIVRAKSEIVADVEVAVLNVDVPELADLAAALGDAGRRVIRCSAVPGDADVEVRRTDDRLHLRLGASTHDVPAPGSETLPINVALALGICLAADTVPPSLEEAVASLPTVANRLTVSRSTGEPTVIDDTYNANPAGATRALRALREVAGADGGGMAVVTPGMVELGARQHEENAALGKAVAELGSALVVVGQTNRSALTEGYRARSGQDPVTVGTREDAVVWAREHLGPGDAVLFENDLPDHFP